MDESKDQNAKNERKKKSHAESGAGEAISPSPPGLSAHLRVIEPILASIQTLNLFSLNTRYRSIKKT